MARDHLKQLSVPLKNQPGALYGAIRALSAAGVNILGVSCESMGNYGFVHLVPDAPVKALQVLKRAGYDVFEAPVFNVDLENKPGELARLTRALADKGVNIVLIYGTTSGHVGRLLCTVDDPEKARPILSKFTKLGPMSLVTD